MPNRSRGAALTILAMLLALMALSNFHKPFAHHPGEGFVFFGARLAGTANEIVSKIPGGSLVDASNCNDGWCEVDWQGKKGFAIASALDRNGSTMELNPGEPVLITGGARGITALAAAELSDLVESRGGAGRVRDGLSRDDAVAAAAALETQRRAVAGLARGLETDLRRLQAAALELRVVPIDTILNRFPRVVRALAQEQGKNVRLTLEGRDVRVDKSMVELLVDPLMHMVRNAVDHGIEPPEERVRVGKPAQASVTLRAVQRGGEVHVQVADDGRGLDERAIVEKAVARGLTQAGEAGRLKPHEIHRFIFAPGFSTAARVTETSGRGVGMDVVLNTVQQLGGDIDVETSIGNGTTFTLRLPLSAALQTSLIVRVDGQNFGIAERFVTSVVEVPAAEMLAIGRQSAIAHKDGALPVYRLANLLWQGDADSGAVSLLAVPIATGTNSGPRVAVAFPASALARLRQ